MLRVNRLISLAVALELNIQALLNHGLLELGEACVRTHLQKLTMLLLLLL